MCQCLSRCCGCLSRCCISCSSPVWASWLLQAALWSASLASLRVLSASIIPPLVWLGVSHFSPFQTSKTHKHTHIFVHTHAWLFSCVSPHPGYLYNHSLWFGVCLKPGNVVQWNVILFSLMGGASFLQVLLCAANIINSATGMIMGHGFCQNQVWMCSYFEVLWAGSDHPEIKYTKQNYQPLIQSQNGI